MYSSDPKNRKTPHGEITLDKDKPISSPAAMSRLNANGAAMGRGQRYGAVKEEKDQQNKEQAGEDNEEVVREMLETRKAGLAVIAKVNIHVENIGEPPQKIVLSYFQASVP